ncbi:MAG: hypothetical protein EPO02_12375 [Nitrospirae bacterium]|nr:MAG: hypothetical protein EPO02_12375 [Nitrospirota bacterium]
MAKKTRGRSAPKKAFSGKVVSVNPWIPAVPVKGKNLLKLVLGVPLALMAGGASAEPISTRTLTVPVELSRQTLSLQEFNANVIGKKNEILRKFEDRTIFLAAQGKGSKG